MTFGCDLQELAKNPNDEMKHHDLLTIACFIILVLKDFQNFFFYYIPVLTFLLCNNERALSYVFINNVVDCENIII